MLDKDKQKRYSISFSISYVRVCEWAGDPKNYDRPSPKILEEAKLHAEKLGDHWILQKIRECEEIHEQIDSTPTPELPKPSKNSETVSKNITTYFQNETQPYSVDMIPTKERLDKELDIFLEQMENKD